MITYEKVDYSAFKGLSKGRVRSIRMQARDMLGQEIRNLILHRVRDRGMGAHGKLSGYSTKPFTFRPGHTDKHKPMVPPMGGTGKSGMFFKGGYKEYVEGIGQDGSKFNLYNTGDFWRDWRYARSNSVNAPIDLGFGNQKNADVARWTDEMRPEEGIFELNPQEFDIITEALVKFLRNSWTGWERSRGIV